MTTDQTILFSLLGAVFVLLLWGRWRYDLVAFSALVVAVMAGVVANDQAFSGFGHPATVIIACVLVVSRGLANSGAIEMVAKWVIDPSRRLGSHIAIMGGLAAALSAMMNNVAALALLMPIDIQAAKAAKRTAALSLMPLSYASILGGLVTLIGTPPNIVISAFREDVMGEPFAMFDFAPVGLAIAVMGVLFIVLGGWRLIPVKASENDAEADLSAVREFVTELSITDKSPLIGQSLVEAELMLNEQAAEILTVLRGGIRFPATPDRLRLQAGDILVSEIAPDQIETVIGKFGLEFAAAGTDGWVKREDQLFAEAVIPTNAMAVGRSAVGLALFSRYGVQLLGLSRQGRRVTRRVRQETMQAGDLLLLLGPSARVTEAIEWLGGLHLARDDQAPLQRRKAIPAVLLFALAIMVASLGWLYLPIALGAVAVTYVLIGIVPLRQLYLSIEWPVIVLLGAMIPIGSALETSGGTGLIASFILDLANGQSAVVVLAILMIVTMTLSDVMNNTATAVIAAPIGFEIANRLGVNPDPFLMAIAVAASCAFLTPIGHKNNMLVMGPGGYRFGDYWRLGLPLEILIVLVAVPLILVVWPL